MENMIFKGKKKKKEFTNIASLPRHCPTPSPPKQKKQRNTTLQELMVPFKWHEQ
jgi:hypothetical protein